ncbi:anaerobic C4-dicarboxylate transporter family protein [Rubeoparvulum massiliense]|uniref:anaerobic C4-dicarboxylate transporter family protein n=1 Tax=Rubeoparvulum massiliense TaxID=1631346 RepID=UPI00065E5458|nr:anaerobic C4-dicarboxylate transporter [Rubeoparvulum massiliense]
MIWLQFLVVLIFIFWGARLGGVGLGVMGGFGLAVLVFAFGLQPTSPPIDVILMILAVVTAAGAMHAAGGLDYLVYLAEKMLRKNPSRITFMGPIVTYLFTFFAGTGHVAYSVLPVIAEVARESGVRPERPMGIAVIASQQSITACPISAATVALLGLFSTAGYDITLMDIMIVTVPATFIGCMIAAFISSKTGVELADDPEYQRRVREGLVEPSGVASGVKREYNITTAAKISVLFFLLGAVLVVLLGSIETLRPAWEIDGQLKRMNMPNTIEITMLTVAALIMVTAKTKVEKVINNEVFLAGATAVIGIFGIAWMGDTFFQNNIETINNAIQDVVLAQPWTFAIALFFLSVLLYSQAATVRALMPLGISLGIPAPYLIAMFPSVNGYFFIPTYGTIIAALNFDRTGTTHIGKYLFNHSFMVPGLVATISAVAIGFGLAAILL